MITVSDSQRDSILLQTSDLMKYADKIHKVFALSNNVSENSLAEWQQTLYKASAIIENLDLQIARIKKQQEEM